MEYTSDNDPGDENDYKNLSNYLIREAIEQQLQVSFRVLAEAATLPPHLVDYHRKILIYWGLLGETMPVSQPRPNDDS